MNKRHNAFKRPWLVGAVAAMMVSVTPLAQAQEQSWRYTYNADGLMETADGPRTDVSDITTYTYDTQGNMETVTNAAGHVTTYNAYDAAGRALSVTDANGITTEFQYHPRGWLTQVSVLDPAGGPDYTTTYTYYADGELETLTQPNGSVLTFEYNGANHLTAIHNDLGERIDYALDAAGNQTRQTVLSADGTIVYVLQTAYDELSRVMDVIGNNGQQDSIEYDANDNPLLAADARGAQTEQQYDALNRVHTLIDAEQGQTQFSYDGQDRIKTVTDARGNTTTYDYDGLGNLQSLDSPDTGLTTYQYDSAGNRIQSTDARGESIAYHYDALNRLTDVLHASAPSLDVHYQYDLGLHGIGRLSAIVDGSGSTQFEFDPLGRLTQKISEVDNVSQKVGYQYEGDVLVSMTYPSGRVVNYQYDSQGRLSDVDTQARAGAVVEPLLMVVEYLPFGPASRWMVGNGLQQNRIYDLDYRLKQSQLTLGQTLFHRLYDYDTVDNIITIDNAVDPSKSQQFDYDLLDRLTHAEGVYGAIDYTYDEVGNRLSRTVVQNGQSLLESYSYQTLSNRLLGVTGQQDAAPATTRNFIYDNAGNVIQQLSGSELKEYEYNAANRMASVSVNDAIQGEFLYNAMGQRVKADYGDHSEYFVYGQAGELLAIVDGSGDTLREYLYVGGQKVALVVMAHGTSADDTIGLGNHISYAGQDGAGSITLTADNKGITLMGNRWRATSQTFTVTANTYLAFDFESDGLGEIQGVALDETPTAVSANRIFNLVGSQNYGITSYRYSGGMQHFDIPVGQHFTGTSMVLGLVNDNDANPALSSSTIRNLRICEGPCGSSGGGASSSSPSTASVVNLSLNQAYAGQDSSNGSYSVSAQGDSITLNGNRWRATNQTFAVSANSVLEFDFSSDGLGEIQGIALDENIGALNASRVFKLAGTQAWGIRDFSYSGGTQHFAIAVGQYMAGSAMVLGLVNDNDTQPTVSTSTISNVRLCEGACAPTSGGASVASSSTANSSSNDLGAQLYYVHNDHLGAPQLLTDAQQNVVWSVDYTPFGVVVSGDAAMDASRFPGQYFDVATGVSYNYFRDYDPSLGRYLQSDPIGLQGGMNTYAYVGGNPVNGIDPTGLYQTCYETATGYYCRDDGRRLCTSGDCAFYDPSTNTQKPDPVDPVKCRGQTDGSVKCQKDPGDALLSCEEKVEKQYQQCKSTVKTWQTLCLVEGSAIGGAAGLGAATGGVGTKSALGVSGGIVGTNAGRFLCPGAEGWENACETIKQKSQMDCECSIN